jgi:transcriptional regulator GlxA family with amidase domain
MKMANPSTLLVTTSLVTGAVAHCNTTTHNGPFFKTNSTQPIHYGILLFPGFQALDAYGPLDILNTLGLIYEFPIKLTVLAKDLEPVSTHVKSTVNHTMGSPLTKFEQKTVVERTFSDQLLLQGSTEQIDVLIVPGGAGTRQNMTSEIAFVKSVYPSLKAVLSVCTGATILARAGVLDGRNATTNKKAWAWATSTGPQVKWIGQARWVVDGNIITSSGISAGMDATYAFIGINYGKKVEENLAKVSEYTRWEDAFYDPFAKVWNTTGQHKGMS